MQTITTTHQIDDAIVRVIVTPSPTSKYKRKAPNIGHSIRCSKVTR